VEFTTSAKTAVTGFRSPGPAARIFCASGVGAAVVRRRWRSERSSGTPPSYAGTTTPPPGHLPWPASRSNTRWSHGRVTDSISPVLSSRFPPRTPWDGLDSSAFAARINARTSPSNSCAAWS